VLYSTCMHPSSTDRSCVSDWGGESSAGFPTGPVCTLHSSTCSTCMLAIDHTMCSSTIAIDHRAAPIIYCMHACMGAGEHAHGAQVTKSLYGTYRLFAVVLYFPRDKSLPKRELLPLITSPLYKSAECHTLSSTRVFFFEKKNTKLDGARRSIIHVGFLDTLTTLAQQAH
jgi:hypothetical protein